MPVSDPVLSVQALTKGFTVHHLSTEIAAFADVSFDLAKGEFLLLRGPNGVGKSTLLRTLWRSCVPLGGRAVFQSSRGPVDLLRAADVDIAWLRRNDIGFATQFLIARPRVSAEALVAEPLTQSGVALKPALETARQHLHAFGVSPLLWPAYPSTFSGGEQQKVNLARALIVPRRLLLLDEPTASLDAAARQALVARLAELKAAGTAMIGVFHHPEDVAHLIDRELALIPAKAVAA
ncbi:phosphonate C-P lyase system protein PhnL [Frigidibacter albus]